LKGKQFHLVTADGGVDCSADPEFQEQNSADLKAAEYKGPLPTENMKSIYSSRNLLQIKAKGKRSSETVLLLP
jgi:hypothetical protein